MLPRPVYLFGLLLAILLSGCKSGEGKPAGFAPEQQRMTKNSTLPFHRVWYEENFNWNACNKIIIRPINTQYVKENNWWKSSGKDKTEMERDLQRLAQTFRSEITKAFSTRAGNRFTVTTSEGPNTLVLELAIVELVPTNAWLNAAGMVGLQMTFDKGAMAVEGRLRDAGSGNIVGAFADREQGKESLVSVRDYTWYSHAEDIMKDWSKQLVVVLNSEEGEHVKDSPWFTLNPF